MKIPLRVVLVAALCLGVLKVHSGFSSPELGITAIPLGGEKADKTALDFARAAELPYPPIEEALSDAALAELKEKLDCFRELPNDEVMAKVIEIREMVLAAIEAISQEDPQMGECLRQLYRSGRISLAHSERRGMVSSIQQDGRSDCGNEPINLYRFPCGRVALYSPEFVQLVNALAGEGMRARQVHYTGPRTMTELERAANAALRHENEAEVAQAEIERLEAIDQAIAGIETGGTIPDGTTGLPAYIAGALDQDDSLTTPQQRAAAKELRARMDSWKLRAEHDLEYHTSSERGAELFQEQGDEAEGIYNGGIRDTSWITKMRRVELPKLGSLRVKYLVGGGFYTDGPEGERTLFQPRTEFRQYREDGATESFTVPEVESVSDLFFYPEGFRALIAGTLPNGDGVVYGAEDEDRDGFFTADALLKIMEGPELGRGLQFLWNREEEQLLGVNRWSGDILNFGMLPAGTEMYPSDFDPYGSIGSRGDLRDYWFGPDYRTIYGSPDLGGTASWWEVYGRAVFGEDDGFYIPGTEFRITADMWYRPAFAQRPVEGATTLQATGTPGTTLELWGQEPGAEESELLATATASYAGGLAFKLEAALTLDYDLQIAEAGAPENISPVETVAPEEPPRIEIPAGAKPTEDKPLPLLSIFANPYALLMIIVSHDLQYWVPYREIEMSAHGGGMAQIDPPQLPKPLAAAVFVSIISELRGDPEPQSDSFSAMAGVPFHGTVVANDTYPPGSIFVLAEAPAIHGDLFRWSNDGSFTIVPLTVGPTVYTFTYYIQPPFGPPSEPATVTITVNNEFLTNPPVIAGVAGLDYALVPCLVFGEGNYKVFFPTYQFRLANGPDDICTEPHWHWKGLPVYHLPHPILGVDTTGYPDPNTFSCGFGRYTEVAQELVPVPVGVWAAFKDAQ